LSVFSFSFFLKAPVGSWLGMGDLPSWVHVRAAKRYPAPLVLTALSLFCLDPSPPPPPARFFFSFFAGNPPGRLCAPIRDCSLIFRSVPLKLSHFIPDFGLFPPPGAYEFPVNLSFPVFGSLPLVTPLRGGLGPFSFPTAFGIRPPRPPSFFDPQIWSPRHWAHLLTLLL